MADDGPDHSHLGNGSGMKLEMKPDITSKPVY